MRYPVIFGYRDTIVGNGFIAGVSCDGVALVVKEAEDEFWMRGVNPGAITAPGATQGEATSAFREVYRSVLFDSAESAESFEAFMEEVERFFWATNTPTAEEWLEAVAEVRAGKVEADWLGKQRTAPKLCIKVERLDVEPTSDANRRDKDVAIAAGAPPSLPARKHRVA